MAVYNAICVSTLLYACEGWTPYRRHVKSLEVFCIRCLQTILHVHWGDKISYVEICRRAGTTCLETNYSEDNKGDLVTYCLETDFLAICFTVSSPVADAGLEVRKIVSRNTLSGPQVNAVLLTPDLKNWSRTEQHNDVGEAKRVRRHK